ncbi:MAG: hypothetical protein Ct9H90mP3_1300 [Flammeovirgaceae bacterium]|nr:MAG: hypothetical protein Ct9H90mP3_1300 [Flammeovirgaceae bacterium]
MELSLLLEGKGEDVNEILKDIENDTSSVDNSEEVNETPIEKEIEVKVETSPAPATCTCTCTCTCT